MFVVSVDIESRHETLSFQYHISLSMQHRGQPITAAYGAGKISIRCQPAIPIAAAEKTRQMKPAARQQGMRIRTRTYSQIQHCRYFDTKFTWYGRTREYPLVRPICGCQSVSRSILFHVDKRSRFLNTSTLFESTTFWSSEFQLLMTRWEKKWSRLSLLVQCLVNFNV